MAESNATQVILTDDGLKIIKAQNTANEVAGNVNDINSDNKLTPSEKLKLKQEYDKDVELGKPLVKPLVKQKRMLLKLKRTQLLLNKKLKIVLTSLMMLIVQLS